MKERGRPDPETPLFDGVRVRLDKEISLEAAKLLGVPVTWGACRAAYKYVRSPDGALCCVTRDIARVSGAPRMQWGPAMGPGYVIEAAQYCVLHPVEIEGETTINWD